MRRRWYPPLSTDVACKKAAAAVSHISIPIFGLLRMLENRADTVSEIGAGCAPAGRRKRGLRPKPHLRTLESLDGRTVGARRAHELAAGFEAEVGGNVTASQRAAIERAACLLAVAEDVRARRLAGESSVSLEDLVRIDNAAMRAVKALGLKPGAPPTPPTPAEYLARRAAERSGKPSGDPA
jgi:hypothetical protein